MEKSLKPFALAIGELCNEWAHLEQWINRLFLSIAGWDYRLPTALPMSACVSIRDQIAAAKIGAITRCPHGDFLDRIISTLVYIDNDLRTARNRFVHDIWAPAEDGAGAIKVDLTPKAKKDAVSGERKLQLWENAYFSAAEVHEVTKDIINERGHVASLVNCFQNPENAELPSLLSAPPPRLHLLRQREKQRQKDKARAAQKPQRQPSRKSPPDQNS